MKIACYLCGKAILTKVSKIAFAGNTFFLLPAADFFQLFVV